MKSFYSKKKNSLFLLILDVSVLNIEDFLRKNHQLAFLKCEEVSEDGSAERIWVNDDPMSSIKTKSTHKHVESVSRQVVTAQNHQQCQSSSHSYSGFSGNSMNTMSLPLCVKSLNKFNLLIVTDDDITPAKQWSDAIYFPEKMKYCLQQLYPRGIEPQCSYGWPNIMRGNSLLLIGDSNQNTLLCLPTVCSITWVCNALIQKWKVLRKCHVAKSLDIFN